MIHLDNISKQNGHQILFIEASAALLRGEKVGLVGPNGAGKTTLFRMITGREQADEGQVSVGYFSQDVGEMAGRSAVNEVMDGAGPVSALAAELAELEAALADPDRADEMEALIERYGEVQGRFEELGGYALEGRAREVLAGLSFSQEMMDGDVGNLSGGWKMRVALAALTGALEGFDETSQPWDVLARLLLDRSRAAAKLAVEGNVSTRSQAIAIWQFLNFLRSQPARSGLPIIRLGERIRRLLRLSDERDLRQLPAAAQGLDAVRLMTIHGAKGLEFPVVHLPGMNKGTMPRAAATPACPPPDGLVEGAAGRATELIREAHAKEQECLFYVGMSRAEDRLFFYAPTVDGAGKRRNLSAFVDRLGTTVDKVERRPTRTLPPGPDSRSIDLSIQGRPAFTAAQMGLYESCPRRFFYTHVLQVGGRRRTTPFMQMHDVVRAVFQQVIGGTVQISDDATLRARIGEALAASGLADHGYAVHYHSLAFQLVRYFVSSRAGHAAEAATELTITIGGDQIVVRPDDVLIRPDGQRTLRRVQTGHRRSDEGKDVGAAAFILAARQAFPDASVEMVHLADEEVQAFSLSQVELQNRHAKLGNYIGQIRAGRFPASQSARTCPGCPAFFICGELPEGPLTKEF